MNSGFNSNKANVIIDDNELDKLLKKYKNIKKYMKSSLYQVKKIDGTESIVKNLLEEKE